MCFDDQKEWLEREGKGRGANIVYEKDGHFIRTLLLCVQTILQLQNRTKILPNT